MTYPVIVGHYVWNCKRLDPSDFFGPNTYILSRRMAGTGQEISVALTEDQIAEIPEVKPWDKGYDELQIEFEQACKLEV